MCADEMPPRAWNNGFLRRCQEKSRDMRRENGIQGVERGLPAHMSMKERGVG